MPTNKYFAKWWFRIISFLLLIVCLILLVKATIILSGYLPSTEELALSIFFIVFFASSLIEAMRPGGDWRLFGILFDNYARKHILLGFILGLVPMLLFLLLFFLWGVDVRLNNYLSLQNFFNLLIVVFCYATLEELFVRGIIFQALVERFGNIMPTVLLGLLFAYFHFIFSEILILAFINLFLASIVFSIMYLKTKSLFLPISFHFFWNIFQIALLDLPISGNYMDFHLFSFNNYDVPKILFGGSFGVEGGLITSAFLIVIIAISMKTTTSPTIKEKIYKRMTVESSLNKIKHF